VRSDATAVAGPMAGIMTILATLWCGVILFTGVPWQSHFPVAFRVIFSGVGVLLLAMVTLLWRERLRGGRAYLSLTADPVPVGVPFTASFTLEKPAVAPEWTARLCVSTSTRTEDSMNAVWSEEVAAHGIAGHVKAELLIRADLPATVGGNQERQVGCTLELLGQGTTWRFTLATRPATETERAAAGGALVPQPYPPATAEQIALSGRRPVLIFGASALVPVAIVAFAFHNELAALIAYPTRPGPPVAPSQPTVGQATGVDYSTDVETGPFDVEISNWHNDDWKYLGRLRGRAEIRRGQLTLNVSDLAVRGYLRCSKPDDCRIRSVAVLLTRDEGDHISTLARTQDVPVNTQLHNSEWHLATAALSMRLPAEVPRDGVWLKLAVSSEDGSTVYVDGPGLQLQQVLASRLGMSDPCAKLDDVVAAMRGGCHQRTLDLIAREPFSTTRKADGADAHSMRDRWLISAIRLGSGDAVLKLIQSGADPNARDPDNPQLSAVTLAAEANDLDTLERLLAAGGDACLRTVNELGQEVTPLKRALRYDAAESISRLLAAGATVRGNDPRGWTTMHIAAYEGAVRSLPLLVRAGADVNEPTPADRHQTPIMTAVQYSDLQTVSTLVRLGADLNARDSEAKNACDWAVFFKREESIRDLVCHEAPGFSP